MTGETGEGPVFAGARITVDLAALRANYRHLAKLASPARVAAVVKADAYGLGAAQVAVTLSELGCRDFFVAHLHEALLLKPIVGDHVDLFVLNGLPQGAESACAAAGVIPVLNSWDQAMRWQSLAVETGRRFPAAIQLDSGMSRLGLPPQDVSRLAQEAGFFDQVEVRLMMSHLACADHRDSFANHRQCRAFNALADRLPPAPRSLANSAGIFLGAAFHGELVRPGLALYGAGPFDGETSLMAPVVGLEATVIQVREAPSGTGVGYGLSFVATRPVRIATVAIGYADGWPRRMEGIGAVHFQGRRLPIIGRISMDSLTIDVTSLPEGAIGEGDAVELVGPNQTLSEVAAAVGAIPYEILTGLGRRCRRIYLDGDSLEHDRCG
ncbi:alanine racemase [Phenylobacterium sp.]|uniref:alanine racemase n=1 Tax=Phenylobacterium sp. TaxID=1871053 RepID=UPI002731E0E7|nr:alanine racemase [Phenylobacterium sp.]MDP1618061.1 alanine racemase [Phenylobacterium sp.]MDP1987288.1 alanine racemase [Phenylobacterium sp.]